MISDSLQSPVGRLFGSLKETRGKALVPFLTAGYPDLGATERLALVAFDAGADMLEIGAPFSDPVADGPAIQYSSHAALTAGVSLHSIFALVERIASKSGKPVLVMGYYNPLIATGLERYVRLAVNSGVSGLIVPDLPPEEAAELRALAREYGLSLVFLVAPTSTPARIKLVNDCSTDFVYAVTVAGVTGARRRVANDTLEYLKALRLRLTKPFVAGFGVSTAKTAGVLGSLADGVVVGSALVDIIRTETRRVAERKTNDLLLSMRKSLDRLGKS